MIPGLYEVIQYTLSLCFIKTKDRALFDLFCSIVWYLVCTR